MGRTGIRGDFSLKVVLNNGRSRSQVIVYDHGQVIEDPALIGRVGFTGRDCTVF